MCGFQQAFQFIGGDKCNVSSVASPNDDRLASGRHLLAKGCECRSGVCVCRHCWHDDLPVNMYSITVHVEARLVKSLTTGVQGTWAALARVVVRWNGAVRLISICQRSIR